MSETQSHQTENAPTPLLGGADIELGNFVQGRAPATHTGAEAAQAILREIRGVRAESNGSRNQAASALPNPHATVTLNPQDIGRKFLAANGSCAYIDLTHIEICLPEVRSARDHLAYYHAMLQIVREAQIAASNKLDSGETIQVLANNSDGRGNSYGAHLNLLLSRRTFENIFSRKIHHLLYLAAYQASSIIFTGAGKVGSENGTPAVNYQIAQRADFFETVVGMQTTFNRPLVNSRDESLCGTLTDDNADQLARLHVIFYDANLCHTACYLKFGVLQIVVAMIAAGQINPKLILDDPVAAVHAWSHDPALRTCARTACGSKTTALDLQFGFLEEATRFVESGRCQAIVPEAEIILARWRETLNLLAAQQWDTLSRRLDWVLKRQLLEKAQAQHPHLQWQGSEMKYLDLIYSSLDPAQGLYWACARSGAVDELVDPAQIQRCMHQPPEDTRAWTRAELLRRADPDDVDQVNWDYIRFKIKKFGALPLSRTLRLTAPDRHTRADCEPTLDNANSLEEALDALHVPASDPIGTESQSHKPASGFSATDQYQSWES